MRSRNSREDGTRAGRESIHGKGCYEVFDVSTHERDVERLILSAGYVLDSHEYERMGEVFAEEIDFANPGRLEAQGLAALIAAFQAIPDPARSHHTTNVVVRMIDEDEAEVRSKALTIRADGAVAPAEYTDLVRRTDAGWRVARRRIRPL